MSKNADNRKKSYQNAEAELRNSEMMAHLLDALKKGTDVGHYGRLVFAMVAHWFMDDQDIVNLLKKQPGMDEKDAQAMVLEVQRRNYNPPKRNTVLAWQNQQDFPICPNPEDPDGCNVYKDLRFPDELYNQIGDFWEAKTEAQQPGD